MRVVTERVICVVAKDTCRWWYWEPPAKWSYKSGTLCARGVCLFNDACFNSIMEGSISLRASSKCLCTSVWWTALGCSVIRYHSLLPDRNNYYCITGYPSKTKIGFTYCLIIPLIALLFFYWSLNYRKCKFNSWPRK